VLVRRPKDLWEDMSDAIESWDVKRIDSDVIDAESGFGSAWNREHLALVDDELQLLLLETADEFKLLVEGRVFVPNGYLIVFMAVLVLAIVVVVVLVLAVMVVVVLVLAIVIVVMLVLAIVIVVVLVISIMVMRVLYVKDVLGEHDLFRKAMVSEHLCQDPFAKRREKEEDELLWELGESVVGRDKVCQCWVAVEDRLVMLLASLMVKVPANVMLTVNLLNGRRPGRELAREQEGRVENGRRRKERVIDSVDVAVLGFDVGEGYLGIEVDLESRRDQLLLHSDPQRPTVVCSKLGTKSGRKGVVLGELHGAIRFWKTMVLEHRT